MEGKKHFKNGKKDTLAFLSDPLKFLESIIVLI